MVNKKFIKLKCICNQYSDSGRVCELLETGKIYDGHWGNFDDYYLIDGSDGLLYAYSNEWFRSLSEIRNEKIDKLLK